MPYQTKEARIASKAGATNCSGNASIMAPIRATATTIIAMPASKVAVPQTSIFGRSVSYAWAPNWCGTTSICAPMNAQNRPVAHCRAAPRRFAREIGVHQGRGGADSGAWKSSAGQATASAEPLTAPPRGAPSSSNIPIAAPCIPTRREPAC